MLPGGSWTDFGTPKKFSKFYETGREKTLPEAPGDLLEGPWTCSQSHGSSNWSRSVAVVISSAVYPVAMVVARTPLL